MEIPGYKIIRELGQGGMSRVFLAIQENFDREVALKVMLPELLADPTFGDRFLREAKIVGQLSHPHIVAVFDVGVHDNHHYISMSYHDDGDLKDRVKNGISPQESLFVVQQVAQALDFAHKQGFVHRDIKPENVLFRKDGTVVLSDFGISKAMDSNTSLTSAGTAIGTPRYMSPEQAAGKSVDGRADLYSLGVMLFEMLTGKVPYDAEDSIAIAVMHVTEPVPQLPDHLKIYQPLIDKMMAKNPDDRYQTGAQIVIDIQSFLNSQNPSASGPTGTVMINTGASITNSQQTVAANISQEVMAANISMQTAAHTGSQAAATGNQAAMTGSQQVPVTEKKSGSAGLVIGLLLLLVIGGGAGFYFYNENMKAQAPVVAEAPSEPEPAPVETAPAPAPAPVVVEPEVVKPSMLVVNSSPENANIYVNGRYQGITPVRLPDLEGEVAIRIKKDGYKTWEDKIKIDKGQTQNLFAELERIKVVKKAPAPKPKPKPAPVVKKPEPPKPVAKAKPVIPSYAMFVVLDPADAQVTILNSSKKFFNGIRLEKGEYQLGVSKNGYKTVNRTVNLLKDMQVSITLEPTVKPKKQAAAGKIIQDNLKVRGKWPEMVVVPAGNFRFGTPTSETGRTRHETAPADVRMPKSFAISRFEITFDEFEKFTTATGKRAVIDKKKWGKGKRPVNNVDWKMAVAYANWLSEQTGQTYRLPTEQEWEYAARAGKQTPFATGKCINNQQANFNAKKRYAKCKKARKYNNKTLKVGSFEPNAWGIYDMHGNVWEWTANCWGGTGDSTTQMFDKLMGGSKNGCKRRVVRGGAYNSRPDELRAGHRNKFPANKENTSTGIRLVREIK